MTGIVAASRFSSSSAGIVRGTPGTRSSNVANRESWPNLAFALQAVGLMKCVYEAICLPAGRVVRIDGDEIAHQTVFHGLNQSLCFEYLPPYSLAIRPGYERYAMILAAVAQLPGRLPGHDSPSQPALDRFEETANRVQQSIQIVAIRTGESLTYDYDEFQDLEFHLGDEFAASYDRILKTKRPTARLESNERPHGHSVRETSKTRTGRPRKDCDYRTLATHYLNQRRDYEDSGELPPKLKDELEYYRQFGIYLSPTTYGRRKKEWAAQGLPWPPALSEEELI